MGMVFYESISRGKNCRLLRIAHFNRDLQLIVLFVIPQTVRIQAKFHRRLTPVLQLNASLIPRMPSPL